MPQGLSSTAGFVPAGPLLRCPILRYRPRDPTEDPTDKFALLALLHAKEGKEQEVEAFLKSAQPLAVKETGTTTWYAVKLEPVRIRYFRHFLGRGGQKRSPRRRNRQGALLQGIGLVRRSAAD